MATLVISKYHEDLTTSSGIHIPYSFIYTSRAEREATIGYSTLDEGKFARQLDNNSIWMLTSATPISWVAIAGESGFAGDMLKVTYDTNDDGIVNNSDHSTTADTATTALDSDKLNGNDFTFFSSTGHLHNDRYYTEIESDARFSSTGHEHLYFAGPLTSPVLTDNGDGTATISSFEISLYDNSLYQGQPQFYTIIETTLSFTINTEQYAVVDYNGGFPILRIENNKILVNGSSIITIFVCWRQDNIIHSIEQGDYGYGLANKNSRYIYNTKPYTRSIDGGLILAQTSVPIARTITVTSSIVYAGINPVIVSAFNSSVDLLTQVNNVSGVWTYTNVSVYDNQYYDNGTDIVLLSDNRYSNRFFYRSIGDVKEVFYTLGQIQYFNEDECYKELPPTPPLILRDHCVYLGRIGIGKGSSTGVVHPEFDHIEEEPEASFYATAGIWTEPSISTSTGVVTVGIGDYIIYDDGTYDQATLNKFTISEQTFVVPNDNVSHYVIANYNSGVPITQLITDVTLINQSDIIPILTVYNLDNVILYLFWDQMAKGLSNKLCHRFVKTDRFKVQSGGLQLSELPVRTVIISSGIVWYGACTSDLVSINSTSTGKEIALWYHIAGDWTRTTTTQYDNTYYDDGTDRVELNPNRYCVNWVYRGVSQLNNRPVIILGGGNYTLAEAVASKQPLDIPPVTASFGVLVGRIIVKKGDATATQIDTLQDSIELSTIAAHNGLSGLQGGTFDEYYHLTSAEYTNLGSISTKSISDLSDVGSITGITHSQGLKWNSTYSEFRPADVNYIAGSGLTLVGQTFSFNTTYGDARYYTQTAANARFSLINTPIVSPITDYLILTTDSAILCNGTFTTTLPAATGSGKIYNVKNIGTGIITLEGNLSETIDGELNQIINSWENIQVIDGGIGAWYIL